MNKSLRVSETVLELRESGSIVYFQGNWKFKTSQEIKKSKIPIFQNSNFPKFQFSKKTKETKKTKKKTILHRPWGEEGVRQSPGTIGFFVFFGFFGFFGKLEFWKIGILENWNFGNCLWGRGGLRQNSILSVAQKSIETQYKYRNKIQTKWNNAKTRRSERSFLERGAIQNSYFPKFQFSKIPIFQKNQRNQKNQKKQFCTDHGGKRGWGKVLAQLFFLFFLVSLFFFENWNFGKLEFWKIGILEIAFGGGGGWGRIVFFQWHKNQ